MRRPILLAFVVLVLFSVDPRSAKALPTRVVERYYYSNACWQTAYCRLGPGRAGTFLGQRISNCSGDFNTISETDLVGSDNWKEEITYDCDGGNYDDTLYHGGYQNWTVATQTASCLCDY